MSSISLRISTHERRFYLGLGGLILFAWSLLVIWQRSSNAEQLSHTAIETGSFPSLWTLAAFLVGWILMTIAMMLPGSLPLLNDYLHSHQQQQKSQHSAILVILAYLAPWTLFGLLAYLGDFILHSLASPGGPLAAITDLILPGIVLFAALYQFSPMKRKYLLRCRPSSSIVITREVKISSRAEALRHGLRLGSVCVGSCWALMLLMFAIGHQRLDWMLALSGVMAAERLLPWGHRLSWLVGLALIAWVSFLTLSLAPGGHSHH